MEPVNPKIILIVLRTYFCNLEFLTTDEDILKYYFTLLNYVRDDVQISWNEIGNDYIIWQPFEHTNPCDIVANMENLYSEIIETLGLESPNIIINPLELASEIAHQDVVDYFTDELGENFEYTDEETGDTFYTEDAQDVFNESYGYILDIINDLYKD